MDTICTAHSGHIVGGNMKEVWKPVVGYEGLYEVSNLGNIKSLHKRHNGNLLTPQKSHNGYLRVTLWKGNRKKVKRVHRLVAEAFLLNENNYEQINHKDGNKENNSISNLEWCSAKHNMMHAVEKGLHRGTRNHPAKSKPVDMFSIDGEFICTYPSMKEAERQTGAFRSSIYACCHGKVNAAGGYHWEYSKGVI